MSKLPEPPDVANLVSIGPDVRVLNADTKLWRVYFQGGLNPTSWNEFRFFGPTSSRFDHHPDPSRVHPDHGVYYSAAHGPTCFAEVFQDGRIIVRTARDPWLVGFQLARDVRLLDLTGTWPTRAGASMNINSGPRPRARRWSRRIYQAYPNIDGLYYASSMYANRPAVMLYERATSAMAPAPVFHRSLADPNLLVVLKNTAHRLGYGLI